MTHSKPFAVAVISLAIVAWSESAAPRAAIANFSGIQRSVGATARLMPSDKFASHRISLRIEGEYANFTKPCTKSKALIGVVNYPRKLVGFGTNGQGSIPTSIDGASSSCPLNLVSIQAQLADSNGQPLAGGAAHFNAPRGKQDFSCYHSIGGPGYCLLVQPESLAVRQATEDRRIGDLSIEWSP